MTQSAVNSTASIVVLLTNQNFRPSLYGLNRRPFDDQRTKLSPTFTANNAFTFIDRSRKTLSPFSRLQIRSCTHKCVQIFYVQSYRRHSRLQMRSNAQIITDFHGLKKSSSFRRFPNDRQIWSKNVKKEHALTKYKTNSPNLLSLLSFPSQLDLTKMHE